MLRRTLPWLLVLVLAGCMEEPRKDPLPRTPSLYTRLGGARGITRVVDSFLAGKHLEAGDAAGLKRQLIEQIGAATGGPQQAAGRSANETHEGADFTSGDFDALVGALAEALKKNGGSQKEQDELKARLEPLRAEVVGRPE